MRLPWEKMLHIVMFFTLSPAFGQSVDGTWKYVAIDCKGVLTEPMAKGDFAFVVLDHGEVEARAKLGPCEISFQCSYSAADNRISTHDFRFTKTTCPTLKSGEDDSPTYEIVKRPTGDIDLVIEGGERCPDGTPGSVIYRRVVGE